MNTLAQTLIRTLSVSLFLLALGLAVAPGNAIAQTSNTRDPANPWCGTTVTGLSQVHTTCYPNRQMCEAAGMQKCRDQSTPLPNTWLESIRGIKASISGALDAVVECAKAPIDCTLGRVFKWIGWIFFYLAGLWMTTMSFIMDTAINTTITSGILGDLRVVDVGWRIVRDACNMVYIFVLLYIAIQTILGLASGATKRLLASVFISALLINFSLFFTKVVIDAGNIVAKTFWDNMRITQGTGTVNSFTAWAFGGTAIQTSLDPEKSPQAKSLSQTRMGVMYFGGAVILFVMGHVFFAGAALMIARTVNLVFLMILSPFAFLGIGLPKFNYFNAWLGKLTQYAFSAPLLVFFLYLITLLVQTADIGFITKANDCGFATLFQGDTPACFSIVFQYMIMITFMLMALQMTVSMSGSAGQKMAGWARSFNVGMRRRAVGFAGRQTIGRLGQKFARSETIQKMAANKDNILVGGIGRALVLAGDKAQNMKFGGKSFQGARTEKEKRIIEQSKVFTDPRAREAYMKGGVTGLGGMGNRYDTADKRFDKHIVDAKDEVERQVQAKAHKDNVKNASVKVDKEIEEFTKLNEQLEALKLDEQKLIKDGRESEANTIRAQIADAEKNLASTKEQLEKHIDNISKSLSHLTGTEVADLDLEVLKRKSVQRAMSGKDIIALNKKINDGKIADPEFVNTFTQAILRDGTNSAKDQMRKLARSPGSAFELDFSNLMKKQLEEYRAAKNSGKLGEKHGEGPYTKEQYYRKEIGDLLKMMGSENVAELDEMLREEIVATQLSKRDLGKIDKLQKEEGVFSEEALEEIHRHIVSAYETASQSGQVDPRLRSAYEHINSRAKKSQGGSGTGNRKEWGD